MIKLKNKKSIIKRFRFYKNIFKVNFLNKIFKKNKKLLRKIIFKNEGKEK